jgi:hypothetical protein
MTLRVFIERQDENCGEFNILKYIAKITLYHKEFGYTTLLRKKIERTFLKGSLFHFSKDSDGYYLPEHGQEFKVITLKFKKLFENIDLDKGLTDYTDQIKIICDKYCVQSDKNEITFKITKQTETKFSVLIELLEYKEN